MSRPLCCRRIAHLPVASVFAPRGMPASPCDAVVLTLDELEALRLADLDGLYQEQAATQMAISRSTFGRIVEIAHRKVAEALVHGKALRIEGGVIAKGAAPPRCPRCSGAWSSATDGKPACPRCARLATAHESTALCPDAPTEACGARRGRRTRPTT
jgi:uncharacterized protein